MYQLGHVEMVFDGKECLHVAKYLAGKQYGPCPLEATQRAAVSRAYFAAFGYVRNYEIENHHFKPENAGIDHTRLRKHLKDRGETVIAGDLHDLNIKIGWCDYDKVFIGNGNQIVEDAIKLSEDIIKNLK
jgi:hypothetical protein